MVPVHSTFKRPEAFWGCSGRGITYSDQTVTFALCLATKMFTKVGDTLAWDVMVNGIHCVLHYLDDFFLSASGITTLAKGSIETKQDGWPIISASLYWYKN